MSREDFKRPSFLNRELNLPDKKEDSHTGERQFYSGSFIVACELRRLPKKLQEQVPTGFMLKQYLPEEYSTLWNELFEADLDFAVADEKEALVRLAAQAFEHEVGCRPTPKELLDFISDLRRGFIYTDEKETEYSNEEFIAGVLSKYSLEAKAKKLKVRFERIKSYFAKELPDLIIDTDFIIGAEKNKKNPARDGQGHLYELQPKVDGLKLNAYERSLISDWLSEVYSLGFTSVPDSIKSLVMQLAEHIKNEFSPGSSQKIRAELLKFIATAKPIPQVHKKIPIDLVHPSNARLTADGLRIIDINYVLPNSETNGARYPDVYHACLAFWQIVADSL